MNKLKASIVIPNYNTDWLLKKNIPKVLEAKANSKNNIIEIVVVDDASPDESVKILKENFPEVKVVKHKINRGFSSSVNTGVRSAKGDLIVLLNTDVVPEKNFLERLQNNFNDNDVFAISMNEGGHSWAKGKFENGFIVHEPGKLDERVHDTFWVSGGTGVFRRELWIKLGGMDEALFSPFYWEDIDLSYRAAKRGYKLLWDPSAKVIHKHETTMSQIPKEYLQKIKERNYLTFIWKNLTSPRLFRKHIVGLIGRVINHPGYIKIVLLNVFRLLAIAKARRREKKEEKISDEAIFGNFI